jgi:hypothetical protein
MTLPTMLPTGAMSSGDYVDYMLTYLDSAIDDESDELDSYLSLEVFDGWHDQWDRQITDLNAEIVALSARVNKLKAKASMVRNAINEL